jgi:hypothetical protein
MRGVIGVISIAAIDGDVTTRAGLPLGCVSALGVDESLRAAWPGRGDVAASAPPFLLLLLLLLWLLLLLLFYIKG